MPLRIGEKIQNEQDLAYFGFQDIFLYTFITFNRKHVRSKIKIPIKQSTKCLGRT